MYGLHKTFKFETFWEIVLFTLQALIKALKILQMLRYWGLKETGTSSEQTFCFTDNQWRNFYIKLEIQQN